MTARGRALALAAVAATAVAAGVTPRPARAYDPATTHAGLTERAVLASGLHRVLARRLGRPLGLFEPVALMPGELDPAVARQLRVRLAALDPAGGYRPNDDGVAPALAWIVAGAVIAQTPAERGQNSFYDPSRGEGLTQAAGVTDVGNSMRLLFDGGNTVRDMATGSGFDLTGPPATQWLVSPANDVGLTVFYAQLDAAVANETPAARGTALARALLALGGTLSVLQDAGEPAHVRNDFRRAFLGAGGDSPFDRGSAFERFVADRYGRAGVPAAATPVQRPSVMAYMTASDRQGLADRTQRRFFSDGTVPEDAVVDRETSAADILHDARESLAYSLPGIPRLELRGFGERRYVYALGGEGKTGQLHLTSTLPASGPRPAARRVLAYERVPGRVRFFLDDGVYADSARALLPEIGAYGAGLVDHLFRAEIQLDVADGVVRASVAGARGPVHGGEVRIYGEDAHGLRRLLGTLPARPPAAPVAPAPAAPPPPVPAGEDGGTAAAPAAQADGDAGTPAPATEPVVSGPSVAIPAGTRRLAAVLRASDDAGDLVAVVERSVR
jgi:hypothetical protein